MQNGCSYYTRACASTSRALLRCIQRALNACPGLGGDQHTGMLVVDSVLPGGPAEGRLQPGDVLVHSAASMPCLFRPCV